MPSCVVPTCKHSAALNRKEDGITFHTFPADEERKAQWTEILQKALLQEFWKPSKRTVICSVHFDEKYFYETKCGLRKLKKEALPNKHLAIAIEEFGSSKEKSKDANQLHSSTKSDSEIGDVNSDSEIGDVDISDLDSIFDTPREAKLRSLLRRKHILAQRHVRRIRTLQQTNRRLQKKIESLTSI